jgi:putative glutamine amidotransferase
MFTIGITARMDEKNLYMKNNYYKWLNKDFNIVIITPNVNNNYTKITTFCDLLLICGGDDVNPIRYNEENTHSTIEDTFIEQMDFDLIKEFVKQRKPIVGICRGIQVINVYFDGNLIQNISEYNTYIDHQKNKHRIIIDEQSILSKYFNKNIIVNSYHHQCVKDIAPYFHINAISKDGFIEGIEYKNIIGIQWHPELMDNHHKTKFILLLRNLILYK